MTISHKLDYRAGGTAFEFPGGRIAAIKFDLAGYAREFKNEQFLQLNIASENCLPIFIAIYQGSASV
jgi:hypothetical protein